jgi:hypothetical protein
MPKAGASSNAAPCMKLILEKENFIIFVLALARTIQAKKRRPKNAGKPRPPRDLLQKKL